MQKTKVICGQAPDHAKSPPRGEPPLGEGHGVMHELGDGDTQPRQQRQGAADEDFAGIPPLELANRLPAQAPDSSTASSAKPAERRKGNWSPHF